MLSKQSTKDTEKYVEHVKGCINKIILYII